MITCEPSNIKIGDIVGYTTITGELAVAQISHIYDGDKTGDCQIYIPGLKGHYDYPINELWKGDRE